LFSSSRKRAQDAKVTKKPKPFVLSETVLQEIWEGVTLVPKDINKRDERRIRVYITKQSGFNPDKILLGIESRKER
jgi:hypothetical protein